MPIADLAPPPYTEIYFVRHGQTTYTGIAWNTPQETPLNEKGIEEIERVRRELNGVKFDIVYSSNTGRTRQTANILTKDFPHLCLRITDIFAELDIGENVLKDCTPAGIIKAFIETTGYPDPSTQDKYPNVWKKTQGKPFTDANICYYDPWVGDTYGAFNDRLIKNIQKIAQENLGKTLLVATHSTVLKSVMAKCCGGELDSRRPLTGSWAHIKVDAAGNFNLIHFERIIDK